MTNLTRWNPNRLGWWDEDPFEEVDRFFNLPFGRRLSRWDGTRTQSLPMDVIEEQDAYVVKASIPGIDPDDLEITFNDNILTVRGQTNHSDERQGEHYIVRERRSGSFARSLTFPMSVDGDNIEASIDNGELYLRVPKAATARTRRINVVRGDGRHHGVGVEADSEGWVEGQATTDRPSTESNRYRQRWTEGQETDPGRPEEHSAGWVEGQQTIPGSDAPSSEGWIEGQTTRERER